MFGVKVELIYIVLFIGMSIKYVIDTKVYGWVLHTFFHLLFKMGLLTVFIKVPTTHN